MKLYLVCSASDDIYDTGSYMYIYDSLEKAREKVRELIYKESIRENKYEKYKFWIEEQEVNSRRQVYIVRNVYFPDNIKNGKLYR